MGECRAVETVCADCGEDIVIRSCVPVGEADVVCPGCGHARMVKAASEPDHGRGLAILRSFVYAPSTYHFAGYPNDEAHR